MNRKEYLKKIIDEFEKWYSSDSHSQNIDYYNDVITKKNLESLSKQNFVKFFTAFIYEGGKVQSGGERSKRLYIDTLNRNFDNFKSFILEPFNSKFNLEDWFKRIKDFNGFGIGIATIYLNRIDKKNYPIMNNKTIDALRKFGYKISSTKNFLNYKLVKKIQIELIEQFSILDNFYKADALNHFILAVYEGKCLINNFIQVNLFEDSLEQDEIEDIVHSEDDNLGKKELFQQIKNCEKEDTEFVTVKGRKVKRYNYLMVKIKEYRGYKCQFCSHEIPKEKGGYYVEACHIKAKSDGGKDILENILVLCPNCHKLFDNWKHENEEWTETEYKVTLNNKKYKAKIK